MTTYIGKWKTILPDLLGLPLDQDALDKINAITPTPTFIRISTGEVKCDCCRDRVTVFINNENDKIITEIKQEVMEAEPEKQKHKNYLLKNGIYIKG